MALELFEEREHNINRDLLKKAPILRYWPNSAIEVLIQRGQTLEYGRGDIIYQEGDAPRYVYFVTKGRVSVNPKRI